jgi:glycosyltransferase involved in cell wall biosynthesis
MDVDSNYHELPEYHPDSKKFSPQLKDTLVKNLADVEIFTAPNTSVLSYYQRLISQRSEDYLLYFENYKNLLSSFTFEETTQIHRNTREKIRIGIILDSSQAEDVKNIAPALETLLEKHKQSIEIILIGWSHKLAEQHGLFAKLPLTYEKPTSYFNYHERLNNLSLDIGLIPFVNNPYNSSGKALTRYLDFSAFMIPVVTSDMIPFNKIITKGENGLIADSTGDWIAQTETLITNPQLRKEMGEYAFKTAWEKLSYTPHAINRLAKIFI